VLARGERSFPEARFEAPSREVLGAFAGRQSFFVWRP